MPTRNAIKRAIESCVRHPGDDAVRDRIAECVTRVAHRFTDRGSAWGSRARETLPHDTGLSPAMVDWGLCAELESYGDVARLYRGTPWLAPRATLVVSSANVFTAPITQLVHALIAGGAVLLRPSSRSNALPAQFVDALREDDAFVGDRIAVLPSISLEEVRDSIVDIDVAVAYGRDSSLDAIQRALPAHARFIRHDFGYGVALVVVPADAADDGHDSHAMRDAADRLAMDIAAYDTHGCMSPVITALVGTHNQCRSFVDQLERSLRRVAERLPRGNVENIHQRAQIAQWKATVRLRGSARDLGDAGALGFVGSEALPSLGSSAFGPGHRCVTIAHSETIETAIDTLPRRDRITTLGVLSIAQLSELPATAKISSRPHVRVCTLGQMQRPHIADHRDGLHPLAGLATLS